MCRTTASKTTTKSRQKRNDRVSPSILYQRQPSPWMVVAIAQSIFWLFGIPILCRKYVWDQIFGRIVANYGQNFAEWIFSISIAPILSFSYILAMIPIYASKYPFFEQYKIQQTKSWPWFDENPKVRQDFWKLSQKSLKLVAVNLFLMVPILVGLKVHIENNILNADKSFFFGTSDEHWPSTRQNIQDILTMTLIQEFGFYVTHRTMHAYPWLYRYHKVHHEYKINTALAAQHNHPIDFLLSLSAPALLALLLVPKGHSISQFQFLVWVLSANMDDHCGYAFPWSAVRWFPGSALTDEHEFHHSQNMGCFTTKLSCFNVWFGGSEHYEKYYGGSFAAKVEKEQ